MKKLINVLWAIEKDLRVIASNTEIYHDRKTLLAATKGTPSASELKFSLSHKSPKGSGKDQD